MKINSILFLVVVFIATLSFSQEATLVEDQNPNYKESMSKYQQIDSTYILTQGSTKQETYVAIDPLEERRQLRSLRRKHRANRLLWRHQERMELARNGIPYNNNDCYYNNCGNSNWWNYNNILTYGSLGLLGYYIFR